MKKIVVKSSNGTRFALDAIGMTGVDVGGCGHMMTVTKTAVKRALARKSDRRKLKVDCTECTADHGTYEIEKFPDGHIQIGCLIFSKTTVAKIRKWTKGGK